MYKCRKVQVLSDSSNSLQMVSNIAWLLKLKIVRLKSITHFTLKPRGRSVSIPKMPETLEHGKLWDWPQFTAQVITAVGVCSPLLHLMIFLLSPPAPWEGWVQRYRLRRADETGQALGPRSGYQLLGDPRPRHSICALLASGSLTWYRRSCSLTAQGQRPSAEAGVATSLISSHFFRTSLSPDRGGQGECAHPTPRPHPFRASSPDRKHIPTTALPKAQRFRFYL